MTDLSIFMINLENYVLAQRLKKINYIDFAFTLLNPNTIFIFGVSLLQLDRLPSDSFAPLLEKGVKP